MTETDGAPSARSVQPPLRIAMIVAVFPTVSETFIVNQIVGLITLGHHVDIFALDPPRQGPVHEDIRRHGLLARTYYLRHDSWSKRMLSALRRLCSTPAWLTPRGLRQAFRILRARTPDARLSRSGLAIMASRELQNGPYDIVHCQFGNLGERWVQVMRTGLLHGALITSIRGHDATQSERYDERYYAELFREAHLLLPVSQSLAERLRDLGCAPEKIRVLHSGIDCRRFEFRPRALDAPEPTRILSVARLVEMKGIRFGIEAVARMLQAGCRIRYDIIGDGPLRRELEGLIREYGIEASVSIHGWKPQQELVEVLQSAHIFLAPSVTATNGETEGIPNAVKEAMAVGLPVVATHHSGIPELVSDGVSGLLVPERDADALASALKSLYEDPDRWRAMGRAGRDRVEAQFDTERLVLKLLDCYDEVRPAAGT